MINKKKLLKLISVPISILFWISVWALISYNVNNEFLLPSPSDTVKALGELIVTGEFWLTAAISLERILFGIIIAALLGTVLGIITANLELLDSLFSPLLTLVKATPIASFIVLALLWADKNALPVFITVLIVLPIVHSNVASGIRSVDQKLIEVAMIYKFSLIKRIVKIHIPTVLPYFLAALRASLGMAWKAGIAAEVLCTPKNAIGTQIYFSKTYLETPLLFAWTLVVIVLSVIIEKLLMLGITTMIRKMHIEKGGADNAQS